MQYRVAASTCAPCVLAHPDATGQQFLVHPAPAVFALDLGMDGADVGQHSFIAVVPARTASHVLWAAQPVEVAPLALTSSTLHETLTRYCCLIW